MRRTTLLILILAAALSACQSGPAQGIQNKWRSMVHPCLSASISNLVWSPDSQQIAYFYSTNSNLVLATDIENFSTKTVDSLAYGSLVSWLPDGNGIIYSGPTGLAVIGLDKSAPLELNLPNIVSDLSISPDSNQIAFIEN